MVGRAIRAIDRELFGRRLVSLAIRHREARALRTFGAKTEAQIVINYNRVQDSPLDSLCNKHGSDKGGDGTVVHPYPWKHHTYTDFLSLLFETQREQIKLVFECGIGTTNPTVPSSMGLAGMPGASLRVWRDYFPNAEIIGADIDESTLFVEERIRTYWVDQRSPTSVEELWKLIDTTDFDLIIDDGLHEFEAGKTLFLGSIGHLSTNGTYIIEDVTYQDMMLYIDFFSDLDFRVDFASLIRPAENVRYESDKDNQLIVVRHPHIS